MNTGTAVFSDEAKLALTVAARIAAGDEGYLGSEHLLYGLCSIKGSTVSELLAQYDITEDSVGEYIKCGAGFATVVYSPKMKWILNNAKKRAEEYNQRYVTADFLLLSLFEQGDSRALRVVGFLGKDYRTIQTELYENLKASCISTELSAGEIDAVRRAFAELFQQDDSATEVQSDEEWSPDEFGVDLTARALRGELDPVIGRERETERLLQILLRRTKNNPVLLGDAGVGKSAVVDGLCIKIAAAEVPDEMRHKRVFSLSVAGIVGGTKYRGDFEQRISELIKYLQKDGSTILFIDELHTLVGAGSVDNSLDLSNILKPMLARGDIQIIGATTAEEYRRFIEKDAALERRFQPIMLEQPSAEQTVEILSGIKARYEEHHRVSVDNELLKRVVDLADKYAPQRRRPDKAIDLMDEAMARCRIKHSGTVGRFRQEELSAAIALAVERGDYKQANLLKKQKDEEYRSAESVFYALTEAELLEVVGSWTGVTVSGRGLDFDEQAFCDAVNRDFCGQQAAVANIGGILSAAYRAYSMRKGVAAGILLSGESGTGKSYLTEIISRCLFGDDTILRLDMSEYTERGSISSLLGATRGYIGYEDGGILTEFAHRHPYSVIVFENVEHMTAEMRKLLTEVLDGSVTDSKGRKTDFSNTIVILTTSKLCNTGGGMGFYADNTGICERIVGKDIAGRLTGTVTLTELNRDTAVAIVSREMDILRESLLRHGKTLHVDEQTTARARDICSTAKNVRDLKKRLRDMLSDPISAWLRSSVAKGALCVSPDGNVCVQDIV